MPNPFERLELAGTQPNVLGDVARERIAVAPGVLETPSDTAVRSQREYTQAARAIREGERQFTQAQRIRGAELAKRDIPTYTTPTGTVEPVRDSSGIALANYDRRNKVGYDSAGNPQKLEYGETGAPKLVDPFAGIATTTDKKTGDQYKISPGLPWKHVGVDREVQQQSLRKAQDKEIAEQVKQVGRPLSIEEKELSLSRANAKELYKQLQGNLAGVPLADPTAADEASYTKQVNDYFDQAKKNNAGRSSVFQGFGVGPQEPEIAAWQQQNEASRQQTLGKVKELFGHRTKAETLRQSIEQKTRQKLELEKQRVNVAQGLNPDGTEPPYRFVDGKIKFADATPYEGVMKAVQDGAIPQPAPEILETIKAEQDHKQKLSAVRQAAASGQRAYGLKPDGEVDLMAKGTPYAARQELVADGVLEPLSPEEDTKLKVIENMEQARRGNRAYKISDDGKVDFGDVNAYDNAQQAVKDGVMKPLDEKTAEALKQKQKLFADAGSNTALKAALTGVGRGVAFLAAAPIGSGAGAQVGSFAGPVGTAIGSIAGGLASGTAGAMAYDKVLEKLGEYNDTIRGFQASSKIRPYWAMTGELGTFGLGLPRSLMKAAGSRIGRGADALAEASQVQGQTANAVRAAVESGVTADVRASASKYLDAIANAYKAGGGGVKATIENFAKVAKVGSEAGMSKQAIAKLIARDTLVSAASMVAIDTTLKSLMGDGQTWGGAGIAALLGATMAGHGYSVANKSQGQLGEILMQGYAHIRTGHKPYAEIPIEVLEAELGPMDINMAQRIARPMTNEDRELFSAFGERLIQMRNEGKSIKLDGNEIVATAQQILKNGRLTGIRSVNVEQGENPLGTQGTPPPTGGVPQGTPPALTAPQSQTLQGAPPTVQPQAPPTAPQTQAVAPVAPQNTAPPVAPAAPPVVTQPQQAPEAQQEKTSEEITNELEAVFKKAGEEGYLGSSELRDLFYENESFKQLPEELRAQLAESFAKDPQRLIGLMRKVARGEQLSPNDILGDTQTQAQKPTAEPNVVDRDFFESEPTPEKLGVLDQAITAIRETEPGKLDVKSVLEQTGLANVNEVERANLTQGLLDEPQVVLASMERLRETWQQRLSGEQPATTQAPAEQQQAPQPTEAQRLMQEVETARQQLDQSELDSIERQQAGERYATAMDAFNRATGQPAQQLPAPEQPREVAQDAVAQTPEAKATEQVAQPTAPEAPKPKRQRAPKAEAPAQQVATVEAPQQAKVVPTVENVREAISATPKQTVGYGSPYKVRISDAWKTWQQKNGPIELSEFKNFLVNSRGREGFQIEQNSYPSGFSGEQLAEDEVTFGSEKFHYVRRPESQQSKPIQSKQPEPSQQQSAEFTPESAETLAKSIEGKLGTKILYGKTTNPSGLQYRGGNIVFEKGKASRYLNDAAALQRKKNINNTPEAVLEEAIWEEIIHSADDAIIRETTGKTQKEFYEQLDEKMLGPDWESAGVLTERPDWSSMPRWAKKAEFVRMVAQGKIRQTITEALYRHLETLVNWLKGQAQNGSEWLKQHVAEIERRVQGMRPRVEKPEAKAPQEPAANRPPPSPPKPPAGPKPPGETTKAEAPKETRITGDALAQQMMTARPRALKAAERAGSADPENTVAEAMSSLLASGVNGNVEAALVTAVQRAAVDELRAANTAKRGENKTQSLQDPLGSEGETTVEDRVASEDARPDQMAGESDRAAALKRVVAKLPKAQREVAEGILKGESQIEIAERLGITPAAVSQRIKGLRKLISDEDMESLSAAPVGEEGARVEPPEDNATSIKNRTVDKERAKRGLPEAMKAARKEMGTTWDEAMSKIAADPEYQPQLIAELKAKARPVNDVENATLLHRQITLQSEYARGSDAIENAQGPAREQAVNRLNNIGEELLDLYNINKKVGTETARGLATRRMMAREDYTLAAIETRRRVAKGGEPLTDKERAQVADQAKEIADLETKLAEAQTQAAERFTKAEVDAKIARIKAEQKAETKKPLVQRAPEALKIVQSRADQARAWLAARKGLSAAPADDALSAASPEEFTEEDAYAAIGAELLAKGATDYAQWTTKMKAELGQDVVPFLTRAWPKARALAAEAEAQANGKSPEGIQKKMERRLEQKKAEGEYDGTLKPLRGFVRQLERALIKQGIDTREPLIDAVHDVLKAVRPETTREETYEIVSGLGIYKQLSKEQIEVTRREIEGESQQIAKINKLKQDMMPDRTGMERREKTGKERRLEKEYRKLLKQKLAENKIEVTDPETQLKTLLQSQERRLINEIEDLADEIGNGRTESPESEAQTNDRIEALKGLKERLQKTLKDIRGVKEKTVEEKLALAKKATQASYDYYTKRSEEGRFVNEKEPEKVSDAELKVMQARAEVAKAEFEELQQLDEAYIAQQENKEIQRLQKSIADLDAKLQSGDLSGKQESQKQDSTAKEALKSERAAMQRQLQELRQADPALGLARWKTRKAQQVADLRAKLASGNFEKRTKPLDPPLDAEGKRIQAELDLLKDEVYQAEFQQMLARQNVPQKVMRYIAEAFNLSRAMMTSLDFSGFLRQGGFYAMSHPMQAMKAFPMMLKAMRSPEGQREVENWLDSLPRADIHARHLARTKQGGSLAKAEEAYMSRYADKIPLVAGSQRGYTTYLNVIRTLYFDGLVDTLAGPNPTEEEYAAIGDFVNNATGRGSLGKFENAAVALNTFFFAPKWIVSRFKLMFGQPFYGGNARTRKAIGKEYGRYILGAGLVLAIAALASGEKLQTDPRASDFLKVRFGKTLLDPMSGFIQPTVLTSRLGTMSTKNSKGEVSSLWQPKFGQSSGVDVLGRFLRTKLAPVPGAAMDLLSGKNVIGEEVTPGQTAARMVVPLSVNEISETFKEQGAGKGAAFAALTLLGMGLQTYDPEAKKKTAQTTKPASTPKPKTASTGKPVFAGF